MNEGFSVLIGMSIAYAASFLGMILAYISYCRKQKERAEQEKEETDA